MPLDNFGHSENVQFQILRGLLFCIFQERYFIKVSNLMIFLEPDNPIVDDVGKPDNRFFCDDDRVVLYIIYRQNRLIEK